MTKAFRVYCNGYCDTFASLVEAQTFLDKLRTEPANIGKPVQIALGERLGTAVSYDPRKVRRGVLTAAA